MKKKINKFLEFINYINDLINNYDLYIKYYEIPSHLLFLNIKLFFSFLKKILSNDQINVYSDNLKNDLLRINNNEPYDSYFYKKFEYVKKIYCGLNKDENGDLI